MASKNDKAKSGHKDLTLSTKPKQPSVLRAPADTPAKTKKKSEKYKQSNAEGSQSNNVWSIEEKCNDCCRERNSNRKLNGHHYIKPLWPGREPGVPPRAQFYNMSSLPHGIPAGGVCPVEGDDMENYFNAHAGVLEENDDKNTSDSCDNELEPESSNSKPDAQDYTVYEDWIVNERKSQALADEGVEMVAVEDHDVFDMDSTQRVYLSEEYLGISSGYRRCDSNDSLYNHCEDEIYQSNIDNSVEDLGDFIETDMPRNPFGCGSSDSNSSHSRTPSDDYMSLSMLGPSKEVTGAGDIQGALSVDWSMPLNIDAAERPPTLLVCGRPSTVSSDSSTNKPHTGSDTDYGFFTPTSCASGSSLRMPSIQSPPLSDSSATCGLASTESSTFASPESEHQAPLGDIEPAAVHNLLQSGFAISSQPSSSNDARSWRLLQRSGECGFSRPRPHSDGHSYAQQFPIDLDMDNLDTASVKLPKDKDIYAKTCNNNKISCHTKLMASARSKQPTGAESSSHYEQSHSSLPHLAAKPATSNRSDSLHCTFEHNNLNPIRHGSLDDHVWQLSDQFNVSCQTSTSDFDQDENSFQEVSEPSSASPCLSYQISARDDCDDDVAFQNNLRNSAVCHCKCTPGRKASGAMNHMLTSAQPARSQWNDLTFADPVSNQLDRDLLINLLQRMQVVEMCSEEEAASGSNADDTSLPSHIPLLNRQRLKKAMKLLGHSFPCIPASNGQLEPDSDSEDGPLTNEPAASEILTELVSEEKPISHGHINSTEKLYSVLLKDAFLKHLQETNDHCQSADRESEQNVKKVMLWTEYQAHVLQVSQIGMSACGATAVINVLKFFDMYVDRDKVCEVIKTNLRAETAPLGEYLLSRSIAGTTADDLITGMRELTNGAVVGKFFALYPERDINLLQWLGEWIEKGAVPVVTLNRQRGVPPGGVIPDAWHHQMVYGVGPKGIYLTNPLEVVPEHVIQKQLCSESFLLIARNDVISRWHKDCNLGILLKQDDVRWQEMNVLGQVVNVLREEKAPRVGTQCPILTSHISIPAWYKSGITLFVQSDSDAHHQLMALPAELPSRGNDPSSSSGTSTTQK